MIDAALFRRIAAEAVSAPIYSDSRFPPSVYYRFLGLLTYTIKPESSVELGVCGGGASLYMALGHPGGVVYGIDSGNEYLDQIAYVQETCFNFQYWNADSVAAAEFFAQRFPWHTKVGVLFIDTTHTYKQTMAEFNAWRHHLTIDAVVVLDDLFRPGMDRVWREMPGEKLRLDSMHYGGRPQDGGFGVVYNIPR